MKKALPALIALAASLVHGSSATAAPPARAATDIQLTLPAPTGPHRVGTVSVHLVDPARGDPWVPSETRRELMVQLWYPAAHVRGHPRAGWVTPGIAAKLAPPGTGVTLPITHGHVGAPAAAGRRPVVIYSPGFGLERTGSTALVQDLASHGFVVVTVDHTHDAQFVEFPDGRLAEHAIPPPSGPQDEEATLAKVLAVRVADTRFVLDQLTAITRGRNPDASHRPLPRGLGQSLDLGRAGMFGSSLGGAEAAEVMRVDQRVRAGLNLDGTFFGRVLTTGLNRPFLMLSAAHDGPDEDETWTEMWGRLRGPRYWLRLENSAHLSFTDLQVLLPQAGTAPADYEPLIGSIDGDRSIAVQRPYVRAFFERHLRRGDGRLLSGPSASYPEMRFLP